MKKRDIIVIGASAGGVQALRQLASELPANLPAAIFVVIHMPPWWESKLPDILGRSGGMQVSVARTDEPIRNGRIYVALADHHLIVDDGRVQLWRGPKENLHRPAINPLFRSAAVTYGDRVIGVILSGSLDDGSTGLWWVKRYDGVAIVQNPQDAEHPDMPRNALEHVAADYVLDAREIGTLLPKLVNGTNPEITENRSNGR